MQWLSTALYVAIVAIQFSSAVTTASVPAGGANRRHSSPAFYVGDRAGHKLSDITWETNRPVGPLHTAY
jgi:hypothetical protein